MEAVGTVVGPWEYPAAWLTAEPDSGRLRVCRRLVSGENSGSSAAAAAVAVAGFH